MSKLEKSNLILAVGILSTLLGVSLVIFSVILSMDYPECPGIGMQCDSAVEHCNEELEVTREAMGAVVADVYSGLEACMILREDGEEALDFAQRATGDEFSHVVRMYNGLDEIATDKYLLYYDDLSNEARLRLEAVVSGARSR
jgi:hypothetical protein